VVSAETAETTKELVGLANYLIAGIFSLAGLSPAREKRFLLCVLSGFAVKSLEEECSMQKGFYLDLTDVLPVMPVLWPAKPITPFMTRMFTGGG